MLGERGYDMIRKVDRFLIEYGNKIKLIAVISLIIIAWVFFSVEAEKADSATDLSIKSIDDSNSDVTNMNSALTDILSEDKSSYVTDEKTVPQSIFVDISGAVNNPGLYELSEGSRINDVLNAAGGVTDKADLDRINRALILCDAQKIYISTIGENINENFNAVNSVSYMIDDSKVNINTATSVELESIPGIGPSIASRIIAFRDTNGPFQSINDIIDIRGIGEKTLDSIREYITI